MEETFFCSLPYRLGRVGIGAACAIFTSQPHNFYNLNLSHELSEDIYTLLTGRVWGSNLGVLGAWPRFQIMIINHTLSLSLYQYLRLFSLFLSVSASSLSPSLFLSHYFFISPILSLFLFRSTCGISAEK